MKNWQQSSLTAGGSFSQSLSRGISFELESSASALTVDEPGTSTGRRRGSLLQGTTGRRGSALHGQISATSESSSSSSSSSSERRRSSCLSDVSVRSSSSKRSSTGDFSSELEDYFDNIAHRSLQTAVIEEEVTPELAPLHDANVCGRHPPSAGPANRHVARITGQNLLEHFVDNLINEAAQQSKIEIEQYLAQSAAPEETPCGNGSSSLGEPWSECLPRLEQYATRLADDIISSALEDAAIKEKEHGSSGGFVRSTRHPAIQRQTTDSHQQHGRRFERQQTVSGFRDALLSDFDNKLMSSNIDTDGPVVTFADKTISKKRRASEPANLNYSKNSRIHRAASPQPSSSSSSSVDYREVIASWFTSTPAQDSVADALGDYVQKLVLDAFVESASSSKAVRRRHHRKKSSSKCAVPDAILLYADRLSDCILQAARYELRASAVFSVSTQQSSLQSVAEKFARSIVDDALAIQSSTAPRLLVSWTEM